MATIHKIQDTKLGEIHQIVFNNMPIGVAVDYLLNDYYWMEKVDGKYVFTLNSKDPCDCYFKRAMCILGHYC